MPIPVLFAVMCAAFLPASRNAHVRGSGGRLRSATVLQIAIWVFAALMARAYLGEQLTPRRAGGCLVIACRALPISASEAVR